MRKIVFTLLVLLISFVSQAQNLYGDMETWRTITVDTTNIQVPVHWYSYDSLTFKVGPTIYSHAVFVRQSFQSTDAHSGNYAAKIISRQQDTLGLATGILVNAYPGVNIAKLLLDPGNPYAAITYQGGTPVTKQVVSVKAWIKYLPMGTDNGEILVQAHDTISGKDTVVGTGDITFGAISSYTQVQIDVSYPFSTLIPKAIVVTFLSSSYSTSSSTPADSSAMYIDDVTMSLVDVPIVAAEKDIVSCYPNPSNGIVNLQGSAGKQLHWQLYDLNGKPVMEQEFTDHTSLDLSYLSAGLYFYNVADEKGIIVQRSKMSIVK